MLSQYTDIALLSLQQRHINRNRPCFSITVLQPQYNHKTVETHYSLPLYNCNSETSERINLEYDWKCNVLSYFVSTVSGFKQYPTTDSNSTLLSQSMNTDYWLTGGLLQHIQNSIALRQRFAELAIRWISETAHHSSPLRRTCHPAYREIVTMGISILPIIFNALDHNPTHWFIALAEITGVNPIPEESAGNVEKMIEAWKEYGRQQGYIK